MKTLNFLEALEANKTRRVRIVDSAAWVHIGILKGAANHENEFIYTRKEVTSKWEVEPEKIEVLCKWERSNELFEKNSSIPCDVVYPTDTELSIFNNLVGKNTKLTIELLD
jgi:hypothetical protein